MALTTVRVSLAAVASSNAVRVDPRYHQLHELAAPLLRRLVKPVPLSDIASFANGVNVPRSAYADEADDNSPLYASVAAISPFVFRRDTCVPLLRATGNDDLIAGTRISISRVAAEAREVLITRSRASAPGVAWPAALAPQGVSVIPAGFLIRAHVCSEWATACYVAAVLNHPVWRLLTAALAAGKSQDNLSQELLASVPIPTVDRDTAESIAVIYTDALAQIDRLYDEEAAFTSVCDRALANAIGLELPRIDHRNVELVRVSIAQVASTRGARLDNRWHGQANQTILQKLQDVEVKRFGGFIIGVPAKGRQPKWVPEEDAGEDTPYAVATATIQAGTVAWERAKPTTEPSVQKFPVKYGDLLIAMDGDGSLGKAAVYESDREGTVDSHVARCEIRGGIKVAKALACYLNSSWGRTQTTSLMTGATGQTQLSPADLLDVVVPSDVETRAESISTEFESALQTFEPVTRRARRLLCESASKISEIMIKSGAIEESSMARALIDSGTLFKNLNQLYPSVRT